MVLALPSLTPLLIMKSLKIFATCLILLVASNIATAQNNDASSYNDDQRWKMLYGDRCFLGEAFAVYDIMDGKAGGGLSFTFFRKGNHYGIEGYYMENRSSLHAFYKRDLVRNPRSWFVPQIGAFAGLGEQLMGSATRVDISGDNINGNINSYLATYKMRPQVGAEINFEFRLGKKVSLNAGVRGMYRFFEGKLVDAAGKVDLNGAEAVISNGTIPLEKHDFAIQASLGFQWRF